MFWATAALLLRYVWFPDKQELKINRETCSCREAKDEAGAPAVLTCSNGIKVVRLSIPCPLTGKFMPKGEQVLARVCEEG